MEKGDADVVSLTGGVEAVGKSRKFLLLEAAGVDLPISSPLKAVRTED